MIEFFIVITLLILVAIYFIVAPFMMSRSAANASRHDQDISSFESRMSELEADLNRGDLSQNEFEILKVELQRRLLDESQITEQHKEHHKSLYLSKPSRNLVYVGALMLPLLAWFIYQQTGAKADWEIRQTLNQLNESSSTDNNESLIDALLEQVNQRLEQRPSDENYLSLLANTQMGLANYPDAAQAYERLTNIYPEDVGLLAQYAQALYLSSQRRLTEQVRALTTRALMMDPQQSTVLGLLGIASFEEGDYQAAINYWQRLLPQLAPTSTNRQMIERGIVEARKQLVENGSVLKAAPPKVSIEVYVSIDGALLSSQKFEGDASVFVYARAVAGPKMPLAVVRLSLSQLPTTVTLDDSMAMVEGLGLANFAQVEVVARVSVNGLANSGAGDIEGKISPVDVASVKEPLQLVIDKVLLE